MEVVRHEIVVAYGKTTSRRGSGCFQSSLRTIHARRARLTPFRGIYGDSEDKKSRRVREAQEFSHCERNLLSQKMSDVLVGAGDFAYQAFEPCRIIGE